MALELNLSTSSNSGLELSPASFWWLWILFDLGL